MKLHHAPIFMIGHTDLQCDVRDLIELFEMHSLAKQGDFFFKLYPIPKHCAIFS